MEPSARHNILSERTLAWAVLAVPLAIFVVAAASGTFTVETFSDRDLARGQRLFTDFPHAGAELGGGAGSRIPGALLGLLFGVPQLLGGGPHAVFGLAIACFVAALLLVHHSVARTFTPIAGAVASVTWLTATAQLETIDRLWNPAFLPLPLAVVLAAMLFGVREQSARALPWLVGATALGAQLHLSMVPIGIAATTCVLLCRPSGVARQLGIGALFGVATYLPYLAVEALHGWPNTQALLQGSDEAHQASTRLLTDFGRMLLGSYWDDSSYLAVRLAMRLPPLLAVVTLVTLRGWSAPRERAVMALAGVFGATLLAYLLGGTNEMEIRYVASLVPFVAALAGAGVGYAIQAARPSKLSTLLTLAAIAMLALRSTALPRFGYFGTVGGYADIRRAFDAISERSGLSMRDIAGRTTYAQLDAEGRPQRWRQWLPVAHLLGDEVFPGSMPPPCMLLVSHPKDDAPILAADALVHGLVGLTPKPGTSVITTLDPSRTLITYTPHLPLCPSTMSQRYVDTPAEAQMRPRFKLRGHDCGQASATPIEHGTRFVTQLSTEHHACIDLMVAVDLHTDQAPWQVTLHSNQLRGAGDNGGWYSTMLIEAPRLVATDTQDPTRIVERVLVPGYVGGRGLATPLRLTIPALPDGTWAISLRADLLDTAADHTAWPPVHPEPTPIEATLTESWVVP